VARLRDMPPVRLEQAVLAGFGKTWEERGGCLSRTPPFSSGDLGKVFDNAVGAALAEMLGGIPIVDPGANRLTPAQPDCVEVGAVRVIGGVRPQNFDVGYRPDGVRFAFDSKTLNDADSIGKNWQNMINDLATEATTVHSRFPHAVVAFLVALPRPCVVAGSEPTPRLSAMIETLERLARRSEVNDAAHMAEAVALVLWDPSNGSVDGRIPSPESPLRIERFSSQVQDAYVRRYKGLPPHAE